MAITNRLDFVAFRNEFYAEILYDIWQMPGRTRTDPPAVPGHPTTRCLGPDYREMLREKQSDYEILREISALVNPMSSDFERATKIARKWDFPMGKGD